MMPTDRKFKFGIRVLFGGVLAVSLLLASCAPATQVPAGATQAPTGVVQVPSIAAVTATTGLSAKCQQCVACQKKKDWVLAYSPTGVLSPPSVEGLGSVVNSINQLNQQYAECGLNIKLIVKVPASESDSVGQTAIMDNFVTQKVDFIVYGPTDTAAVAGWVKMANDAGIPIGQMWSAYVPTSGNLMFTLVNNDEQGGKEDGEYACAKHPKGILIMQGVAGQYYNNVRMKGVMEGLAECPDVKILASMNADWERAKGMALMEDWISTYHGQVEYVLALNDEMALGAIAAIKAAGLKNVTVTSWDGSVDACNAVLARDMEYSMDMGFTQQGITAVGLVWDTWNGKTYPLAQQVKLVRITPDNAQQVLDRVAGMMTIGSAFLKK